MGALAGLWPLAGELCDVRFVRVRNVNKIKEIPLVVLVYVGVLCVGG